MRTNLILSVLMALSLSCFAQDIFEVKGIQLHEHHHLDYYDQRSAYNFKDHRYMKGFENKNQLNAEVDIHEYAGPYGAGWNQGGFGFSAVTEYQPDAVHGNGLSYFHKVSGVNYDAITDFSQIQALYNPSLKQQDMPAIVQGDIIVGKIRSTGMYVLMKVTANTHNDVPGATFNISFEFDYKYGYVKEATTHQVNHIQFYNYTGEGTSFVELNPHYRRSGYDFMRKISCFTGNVDLNDSCTHGLSVDSNDLDMRDRNGKGRPVVTPKIGFTSGSDTLFYLTPGNRKTKFMKVNADYGSLVNVNDIKALYNESTASLFIDSVDSGEVIVARIREGDMYVAMHVDSVYYGSTGWPWFHFSYKYAHDVSSTGLSNKSLPSIEAFPNPVGQVLNVKGASKVAVFTIRSIAGKQVLKGTLNNGQINIEKLSSGTYVLFITDGNLNYKPVKIVKK